MEPSSLDRVHSQSPPRRWIRHPGPPAAQRSASMAAPAIPLSFRIEPGWNVNTAIAHGFADAGCAGGFIRIRGGRFQPFHYVIPAGSPGTDHAAWYSATYSPEGPVQIEEAGAIIGRRDGAPFIHCHGLWSGSDGIRRMGHLLPLDTKVAETVQVTGIGLIEGAFTAVHDPETNFTLFTPDRLEKPTVLGHREGLGLAVTIRPNEDVCLALEAICAGHGVDRARIHGIGSLNGARFEDGGIVDSYATELLVREGLVVKTPQGHRARIDIAIVDMDGAISEGVLVRGQNPVCVTAEFVIEPFD